LSQTTTGRRAGGKPWESQPEGGRRFTSHPARRPSGRYEPKPAAPGPLIQVGGSDRRSGWRRAASRRTPCGRAPTGPGSPRRCRLATRAAGRRSTQRRPWRCGPRRSRAAARAARRRRSPWTMSGCATGRCGRRASRRGRGGDRADAVGVFDQRGAVGNHGIHHGVPVTAELACHLADRPAVAADLAHTTGRPGR
jgi:hypothetical protein